MRPWLNITVAAMIWAAGNYGFSWFLRRGLERYYGLTEKAEMLILGHSHIMLALNQGLLEKGLSVKVAKYTREGVTVAERKLMAEQYLSGGNSRNLRCVIYGVDPYLFTASGLSKNSYVNFYPMLDDPVVAPYLRSSISCFEYWKLRLLPLCRFQDASLNAGLSGWLRRGMGSLKTGRVDLRRARSDLAHGRVRAIALDPEAVQCFFETLRLFTARGVRVILLNTPIIDLYNRHEPEAHRAVARIYEDLARQDPGIEYWDLNPRYERNYELFRDPIHLNREGQRAITEEVVEKLRNETAAH